MITDKDIEVLAWEMLCELEERGTPEVVLIPAPDPRHDGQMIRAVQNANPGWYQAFCARFETPRPIKMRTIIKRRATINALERIAAGQHINKLDQPYISRLVEFIKLEYSYLKEIPF